MSDTIYRWHHLQSHPHLTEVYLWWQGLVAWIFLGTRPYGKSFFLMLFWAALAKRCHFYADSHTQVNPARRRLVAKSSRGGTLWGLQSSSRNSAPCGVWEEVEKESYLRLCTFSFIGETRDGGELAQLKSVVLVCPDVRTLRRRVFLNDTRAGYVQWSETRGTELIW